MGGGPVARPEAFFYILHLYVAVPALRPGRPGEFQL